MTKPKPPKTKDEIADLCRLASEFDKLPASGIALRYYDYLSWQQQVNPKVLLRLIRRLRRVERLHLALKQQRPADDDLHALVRGLKALVKGEIVVVPTKKAPKTEREVIEYVNALADDAAAHPEKLGDMGELLNGVDELLDEP